MVSSVETFSFTPRNTSDYDNSVGRGDRYKKIVREAPVHLCGWDAAVVVSCTAKPLLN